MLCFGAGLSALERSSQTLDEIGKDIAKKSSPKMPFVVVRKISRNTRPEGASKPCALQLRECAFRVFPLIPESITITAIITVLFLCHFPVVVTGFSCLGPKCCIILCF